MERQNRKIATSRLKTEGSAGQIAWSPDLKRVASSIYPNRQGQAIKGAGISIWEAATGKLLRTLTPNPAALYYGGSPLAWSPNGKQLAASFDGSDARLWDVASGKRLYQWFPEDRGAEASVVAFSPNVWNLAVGRVNTKIAIHDTRSGQKWRELERNGNIRRLAFSPDNSLLASGAGMWTPVNGADKPWEERGGETQIWNMKTGSMGIQIIAFPPVAKENAPTDSIQFATITVAGQVKLWDVKGLKVEE